MTRRDDADQHREHGDESPAYFFIGQQFCALGREEQTDFHHESRRCQFGKHPLFGLGATGLNSRLLPSCTPRCTLILGGCMAALKVGVREFRERIASFLESDTPVAVTRRGETLGVYVPTRGKRRKTAELSELKAAADRLAEALSDVDEGKLVAEFKQMRRSGKVATR